MSFRACHNLLTIFSLSFGLVPVLLGFFITTTNHSVFHDELWHYPQAVSLLRGTSWRSQYELRLGPLHLPVVSGPYQGALKTYLLVPWLSIFGTSPWSLRAVNVVLFAGFLVAMYWALVPLGRLPALGSLLVPWVVPASCNFMVMDLGPFLIALVLATLGMGFLVRFALGRRQRYLTSALACLSLLISDKLTNIPLAVGLFVALIFISWRLDGLNGRPSPEPNGSVKLLFRPSSLAAIAFPLMTWLLYFARNGFAELQAYIAAPSVSLVHRVTIFWPRMWKAFSGGYGAFSLTGTWPGPFQLWALPGLLGLAGFISLMGIHSQTRPIVVLQAVILGFFVVVLMQIVIPGLYRPWHFLPLLAPVVFCAFAVISCIRRGVALVVVTVASSTLAVHDTYHHVQLLKFLKMNPGRVFTSRTIYDLNHILLAQNTKTLVCLNYSLCNPLFVLSKGSFAIVDLTWWKEEANTWTWLVSLLRRPGTVAVWREVVPLTEVRKPPSYEEKWLNGRVSWLERMQREAGPELERTILEDGHGTRFVLARLPEKR